MSWDQQYKGLWGGPVVSCMYISLYTWASSKSNVIFNHICDMVISACAVLNKMSFVY
jgi:hypothetical protein